jgi:hypothetical protein
MKKFSLLLLVALITSILQAQIPNSGFESWTNMGTYETPDQWGNMNAATASANVFTTAKGTPGASGSYFVKLTTKAVGTVVTPGIIVSGQLNTTTWQPISGFPYTLRAEKLKGKYQYMGYNNDSATISGWLTKWNTSTNHRDTIATLKVTTAGMVHTWTNFALPFTYFSTENPDTAVIMISSSSRTPKKNSFIWLDGLLLDGLVTAIRKEEPVGDINVFPSPARTEVNLAFNSKSNFRGRLQVIDNVGNTISQSEVEVHTGSNILKTDLSMMRPTPGMYFVCLQTPAGQLTRKFIIGR